MLQPDLSVESPDDHDTVWRYMDLGKYVSLLKSRSLYLCPLTALEDPFEGSSPPALSFQSIFKMGAEVSGIAESEVATIIEHSTRHRHWVRGHTFVNCWHMSEYESEAMWKLYSASNESICIRTRFGKIRAQLPDGMKFGKVRYVDFDSFSFPSSPFSYDPVFLKRRSFEHEKEVRIVQNDILNPDALKAMLQEMIQPNKMGKSIPINLHELIEGVSINPISPDWFVDVVQDVTQKYGFNFDVSKSQLALTPTF